MVFARQAFKIGIGKHQRLIYQAVYHQTVITFAKLDSAGMMALKCAALGRNRTIKGMNRREVYRRNRACGQPRHVAPHDIAFKFNWQPIGRGIHPVTGE